MKTDIRKIFSPDSVFFNVISNVSDLEEAVSDQGTRLTAAEENIQGKTNFPQF